MKKMLLIVFLFLFSFSAFSQTDKKDETSKQGQGSGRGSGSGSGSGSSNEVRSTDKDSKIVETKAKNSAIRFVSKPKPNYTDSARQNNVQGEVILQVTFLKNGKIGKIKVVEGLSDGLSAQAVEAAKTIKFEPARKNGKPKTVKMKVQYTFTIY